MVASGSRTMIAGSLSSCIAGFHQSSRFSPIIRPETLVRSCVGTGPAFAAIGVGSRAHWGRPQIDSKRRFQATALRSGCR